MVDYELQRLDFGRLLTQKPTEYSLPIFNYPLGLTLQDQELFLKAKQEAWQNQRCKPLKGWGGKKFLLPGVERKQWSNVSGKRSSHKFNDVLPAVKPGEKKKMKIDY